MATRGIRSLAIADLDESTLRGLIEHGEDLFVERKLIPPKDGGFGATVASFANTIGGWVLLGIADDGTIKGWEPPGRADAQSHLGEILRQQCDPLPPFVAAIREIDGRRVGVV